MPFTIIQSNTAAPPLNEPAARHEAAAHDFRIRRLIILCALVVAWFAILPFYPADLDYFAGGIVSEAFPRNHLGKVGAFFGWGMFMTLGLGTYVLLGTALLCSLRRLVWRGKLRKSSWDYYFAILFFGLGCSLLLGLFPEAFAPLTKALNISKLPGGIIGHLCCAPGSGFFFLLLNYTGCLFISVPIILVSFYVIWSHDWAELFEDSLAFLQRARAAGTPAPAEPTSPADPAALYGTPTPPAPVPTQPPAPSTFTPLHRQSFQGRRAGNQPPATTQNFEPVAAQPQTPRQPELPILKNLAKQQVIPQVQPPPAPAPTPSENGEYVLPGLNLYNPPRQNNLAVSGEEIESRAQIIQRTLDDFKVDATVVDAVAGPQITLYEIEMGNAVKPENLNRLHSSLLMNLQVTSIRLLTPIPGRPYAGVEVPNKQLITVTAYELFASKVWQNNNMTIPLMLGKNISGNPEAIDLAKAPHLLVAGSTGSGKSVTMNMMIQSMLLRFTPDQLKLIMFDPKYLEFAAYSTVPHLLSPVINEPEQVGTVLNWAIDEMNRRYRQLTAAKVKNLIEFNTRPDADAELYTEQNEEVPQKLPYIVIIIDELADIMAHAQKEVDHALSILAAKSRAAGIHMIIATQRPDAKTITGVIKANFPWRIALRVTDLTNSRVIMDCKGAEMLLGKGDMLLKATERDPVRIQSGYASNEEIASVVNFCSAQARPAFDSGIQLALEAQKNAASQGGGNASADDAIPEMDGGAGGNDLVSRALEALATTRRPTISNLQRRLGIGYNRAATLIEELENLGYVGPQPSSGMREIYWDAFPNGNAADAFVSQDDMDES